MTTPAEKDAMALVGLAHVAENMVPLATKKDVQVRLERAERFASNIRTHSAHLAARVASLEAELAGVRRAAKAGMEAAHAIGTHDLALGRKLQAESRPEVIASEREANALLTEMLDAAEARATRAEAELAAVRANAERYVWLRDNALQAGPDISGMMVWCVMGVSGIDSHPCDLDELDAAIDAARGAG